MNRNAGLHSKRDKAVGLAAALALHAVVLYFLMSYHIIPPPSEAVTMFVNCINATAPARITAPPQQKTTPAEAVPETPGVAAPPAPNILTNKTPVVSPAEPIAPPPLIVKASPVAVPVTAAAISRPAQPPPTTGSIQMPSQPLLMTGELSVVCSDRTAPAYPKLSSRLGEQGKTVLLVELDEQGRVANVNIKTASGFPRLDEAAITAVKSWHCSPAKRNGVAVRSVALQPFNFTLKGR